MTLSPRGERTTPTLLQPRQPALRKSQHDAHSDGDADANSDADAENEKEDDADTGNDDFMPIIQSLAMDPHYYPCTFVTLRGQCPLKEVFLICTLSLVTVTCN